MTAKEKPEFTGVHRNALGVQVCVQRLTDEQLKMLSMVLENRAKRFVKMLNGERK